MLSLDRSIVEFLNRNAQQQPWRLAALVAATYLVAVPIAIMVAAAVAAWRRRDTHAVAVAVLAGGGAAIGLGLEQLATHLYFRLRPYWALPAVHPIGGRAGSSSFFPGEVVVAAAVTVGALLVTRRWRLVSLAAAVLVALGRVTVGAAYPSDALAGLAVGGLAVAVLLPGRQRLQRLLIRLLHAPGLPISPRRRELRLGVIALVLLVGLGGWLVARVQDHGLEIALDRADERLDRHLPTDARLYRQASIQQLATGHWRPTRARVYGQVSFVARALDGDIHVTLKAPDGSFVVLEIIPELPVAAPHNDDRITAWGIVRHDGIHNWWELHPLVGWARGRLNAPSAGGLDD